MAASSFSVKPGASRLVSVIDADVLLPTSSPRSNESIPWTEAKAAPSGADCNASVEDVDMDATIGILGRALSNKTAATTDTKPFSAAGSESAQKLLNTFSQFTSSSQFTSLPMSKVSDCATQALLDWNHIDRPSVLEEGPKGSNVEGWGRGGLRSSNFDAEKLNPGEHEIQRVLTILDEDQSDRLLTCLDALESAMFDYGEGHPQTLMRTNGVALLLHEQGYLDEAEPYYREVLRGCKSMTGPRHPYTLTSTYNLADLLADQHHRDTTQDGSGKTKGQAMMCHGGFENKLASQMLVSEAEHGYREVVKGRKAALGDRHPDTLTAMNGLGVLLQGQGRMEEAEPFFREALEGRRKQFGRLPNTEMSEFMSAKNLETLQTASNLSGVLQHMGHLDEAELLSRMP